MQEKELLNPEELQSPKLATTPVEESELKAQEIKMVDVEDQDKNTYVKISPTFYIKFVETEEGEEENLDDEGNPIELFKILNPETGVVVTRELTDEEKKEILILQLKESRIKFRNTVHKGKVTTNKFGADYRKKRQTRNKMAKASRKANR